MALTKKQVQSIEKIIEDSLRNKLEKHNPEPAVMPFHTRLLGKDRLALYSFIHSLNTNFGTSIFEPVAVELASFSHQFKFVKRHTKSGSSISKKAQDQVQEIMNGLTAANFEPNKHKEIEAIREVCQSGEIRQIKPTIVDLYLEKKNREIYLIDLKTTKPNKGNFKEFKRTLLEWVAVVLCANPKAKINTLIAIPYNPYEPKPYARWTMAGMLDLEYELKVAKEFWDFLGGDHTYDPLLDCFEEVGIRMKDEINNCFGKFK